MIKTASAITLTIALSTLSHGVLAGGGGVPEWAQCAQDGTTCRLNGKNTVRYGYTDNWSEKEVKGDAPCNPDFFADGTVTGVPFSGAVAATEKACEVLN